MNEKALKILIRGHVQGVGYRRFAQRKASECQILGWTRNLINGDVEVLALGNEINLQNYLKTLRQGPSFGRVEEVITTPAENEKKFSEFSILPDGDFE